MLILKLVLRDRRARDICENFEAEDDLKMPPLHVCDETHHLAPVLDLGSRDHAVIVNLRDPAFLLREGR